MTTEEIKALFDLFQSLGETGKEAFIWWLAISYLKMITVVIGGAVCICYPAKLVHKFCMAELEARRQ